LVAEPDAAPAGVVSQPRLREAPGRRPLQLRGAAFNGWTRRGWRAAKAAWIRCPRPEARSRGQKSRDGAPCGERACRKGTSTPRGVGLLVAPHGAPFPCLCRGRKGRKTGLPGAPAKNTGGGALA